MRNAGLLNLCLISIIALSACGGQRQFSDADVEQAIADVNVIDESNLNEVMLTVADPNEAVSYFQRASAANPDRIDLRRGLAKSLVFGMIIALIGVSSGFSVKGGAEGVGRATTQSVVMAISWIVIADMVFTFFLNR